MGVAELLSSLSVDELDDDEEEEEEDDDSEVEDELDVDRSSLLETSVSDTGIETEIEVGAPGLGPFVTSGTLFVTLSIEGVAAAALTALDKSISSSSELEDAVAAAFEADCLTGLTTTSGSLSSSNNCRRLSDVDDFEARRL